MGKLLIILSIAIAVATAATIQEKAGHKNRKNIVFILADDLGYNDVSWHNPDMIMPNLQSLADEAIVLENHYAQPLCSPTRAAIMTGYYPIHTGRQFFVIEQQAPVGLFTNFTIMPQYLNGLGYASHIIGKWHLGHCADEYLPTSRGFRTHRGYYNSGEFYFNHSRAVPPVVPPFSGAPPTVDGIGYDWQNNGVVDWAADGTYSSYLFAEYIREVITNHANTEADSPLFLYLPFQQGHIPLQAPQNYLDMYPNQPNVARQTFSAMVTAMDDAVGTLIRTLKLFNMFDDTIIVFSSDNGGDPRGGGNNWPLRGGKAGLTEGGTKAVSFVHAPFLKQAHRVYNGLMHVVDWLPTLYTAAGGNSRELSGIDGIDQWESITRDRASKRTELLYNIQPFDVHYVLTRGAAIRDGDMKVICGAPSLLSVPGWWNVSSVVGDRVEPSVWLEGCNTTIISQATACMNGQLPVLLFDLSVDPEERNDLSAAQPHTVTRLLQKLDAIERTALFPNEKEEIAAGNPANWGGAIRPGWCTAEPQRS